MDQNVLEEKVRELFEDQGFVVEKDENYFSVSNGEQLDLVVFSSENFSVSDAKDLVEDEDTVFVDEDLSDLRNEIDNKISVIKDEEERNFDLPSFEIIGEIAIINDISGYAEEDVEEGILHHHPNIETILVKETGLSGEFRVGDYRKIYGEDTETVHKEYGCKFKVDPTKAYFSERFSRERERISKKLEDGERLLVMFAGVGPFPILAAKDNNVDVVAIEKNPVAADYFRENIKLNNLEGKVKFLEGDVRDLVPDLNSFDRVVMPLPGSADKFLDLAFSKINDKGVIHYYRFLREDKWFELEGEVSEVAGSFGFDYDILERVECGDRSASEKRVCLDIKIRK